MDHLRTSPITIHVLGPGEFEQRLPRLAAYFSNLRNIPFSYHPAWLSVLSEGLGHTSYCIEAVENGSIRGFLALAFVRSPIFGRFLVSLPYLNYGSPVTDDDQIALQLIDAAVNLADRLDVRYLELRQERAIDHPALDHAILEKVHMRLVLPDKIGTLWDGLSSKVRNQVRKGQKCGLSVSWGGVEILPEFLGVFSTNMRDLGTPSYGRSLFREIIAHFPDQAEFCVVRVGSQPLAAALLMHGRGITEVPSASALRQSNDKCANMYMYWNLLERAVNRCQGTFDFGRSTIDSNTYRFKKQWGANPSTAVWQYYLRRGGLKDARPDNPRYRRLIRLWQRLPVWVARRLGPPIVRGIP